MGIKHKEKKSSGFSLLEMSIVIIVIGLILAAIMKGHLVVDVAKNRALISQINNYKAAVGSFYAKYNAFPGDFIEASIYWTGDNTANGNGDGKISFQNDVGTYEGYQAWQHLSNENMVNLLLLGTQTNGIALLDVDVPRSKAGGGYFFDYNILTQSNVLVLGAPLAPSGADYPMRLALEGSLTPKQAYEVDIKMDDGLPLEGAVFSSEASGGVAGRCMNANENTYNISLDEKKCVESFKIITN